MKTLKIHPGISMSFLLYLFVISFACLIASGNKVLLGFVTGATTFGIDILLWIVGTLMGKQLCGRHQEKALLAFVYIWSLFSLIMTVYTFVNFKTTFSDLTAGLILATILNISGAILCAFLIISSGVIKLDICGYFPEVGNHRVIPRTIPRNVIRTSLQYNSRNIDVYSQNHESDTGVSLV